MSEGIVAWQISYPGKAAFITGNQLLVKNCEMEGGEILPLVYQSELTASQARLSEAVKVLERANTALNDWLNIYASDMCEENRVAEAHKRVSEYGTIGYIADVTAEIRSVLATLGEEND